MERRGAALPESFRRRGRRSRAVALPVAIIILLMAAACSGASSERGPRELALGVDACEYCHMSVDDPTRAAQWVPEVGPIVTFDEPGCLVAWLQRNSGVPGRGYVGDSESGGWVPVEEASYLIDGVRTGMGFDVVAYGDAAAAAGRDGEVIGWDELIERGVRDAHAH